MQQIIKKKRFNFNSLEDRDSGVDITVRIQTIGTTEERWYEDETPLKHSSWSKLYVNIVVSGTATTRSTWGGENQLRPIEDVAELVETVIFVMTDVGVVNTTNRLENIFVVSLKRNS